MTSAIREDLSPIQFETLFHFKVSAQGARVRVCSLSNSTEFG